MKRICVTFLLSLALLQSVHSATVTWKEFSGTLPIAAYPLDLEVGDVVHCQLDYESLFLSGVLLYMYQDGMDIMDTDTFTASYNIGDETIDPQILDTTIVTADRYYVVAFMPEALPLYHHMTITVNGVEVLSQIDTNAVTNQGFSFITVISKATCAAKFEYVGPPATIMLKRDLYQNYQPFDPANPGNNVVAIQQGTSNTLYTFLMPDVPYIFIINHGITSATSLQDFSVQIKMNDQSSWQCFSMCETSYVVEQIPGFPGSCQCQAGFSWNSAFEFCQLTDCTQIPNAIDQLDPMSCNCDPGYVWEQYTGTCQLPNPPSPVPGGGSDCSQYSSYDHIYYNEDSGQCEIKCNDIEYATENRGQFSCHCESPRVWNKDNESCQVLAYVIYVPIICIIVIVIAAIVIYRINKRKEIASIQITNKGVEEEPSGAVIAS